LSVIGDFVILVTFSSLSLATSLYFDGSNSGWTDYDLIDVEILFATFCWDIVKNAKAL
jgi:hypothetical protein